MIVLASTSPRRRELLARLGVDFECEPPGVDEDAVDAPDAVLLAVELAAAKAGAVAVRRPGDVVLGSDTTLALDGVSLGTPTDRDHARAMLRELSGRTCAVTTGVALHGPGRRHVGAATALVTLRTLADPEIEAYLGTGAADDKAGALEIQDRAAGFVERIEGCGGCVVGLPLCHVAELLEVATPCPPGGCTVLPTARRRPLA